MPDQFNSQTRPTWNLSATTDPTSSNDSTNSGGGYSTGSVWFNTTNNRVWTCISAVAGAAVWSFDGAAYSSGGTEPSNVQTAFGGSAVGALLGAFYEEGNLYRNVGNPIAGNTADAHDDILGGVQLPAGCFDVAGRGITVTAQGITGATTNNKRFKIFVNPTMTGQTVNSDGSISGGYVSAGTAVCDSGAWVNGTTANNAAGWMAQASLFKYGVNGSNTQVVQGTAILGTLHGGIQPPQFLTTNESNVINIVVTGSSYTSSVANDMKLNLLQVTGNN